MKIVKLGLASLVLLASSCATVAHGRFQQVPVNSTPDGAAVYADCGAGAEHAGDTPMVVKLRRKADRCIVTLRKEGYEDVTKVSTRHMSGWVWGNVLLSDGFLFGAAIDLADGAFYNRAPASLRVELTPIGDWRSRSATR